MKALAMAKPRIFMTKNLKPVKPPNSYSTDAVTPGKAIYHTIPHVI